MWEGYKHKRKFYPVVFEVIDQDVPNILRLTTCVELNLVQRLDAIKTQATTDILDSYSDIF